MRRLCFGITAVVLALLAAPPARATVMLKMELTTMVGRADVIFVGKVLKLQSHWSEDHRHIVTDYHFQVKRAVRGAAAGSTVVVRSLGGAVDGIGMRISGSPQFRVGEEAMLFTDIRNGHRYVTGMSQGVYQLQQTQSGQVTVLGSSAGVALARRSASGRLELLKEPPPQPEPLEGFVKRVHETIALCAREKSRCQQP